jgi:hypothetical protein
MVLAILMHRTIQPNAYGTLVTAAFKLVMAQHGIVNMNAGTWATLVKIPQFPSPLQCPAAATSHTHHGLVMDGAVAVHTIQQSVVGNLVIAVKRPVKMPHGTTTMNVVLLATSAWIHRTPCPNPLQSPVAATSHIHPFLVMDYALVVNTIPQHACGNLEIAVKQHVETPHGHINMNVVRQTITVRIQLCQNALG